MTLIITTLFGAAAIGFLLVFLHKLNDELRPAPRAPETIVHPVGLKRGAPTHFNNLLCWLKSLT